MTLGVAAITFTLVILSVVIHFEALSVMAHWLPRLPVSPRRRVVFGVLGGLLAHVLEVWGFACGFYLMIRWPHHGALVGNFDGTFLDCGYFSYVAYTSLGLGDISPTGPLRFLVVMETTTGLVLIASTASFLFLLMQRDWREHHRQHRHEHQSHKQDDRA